MTKLHRNFDEKILYWHKQGLNNQEIANKYGLTRERIRQRLFNLGISRRKKLDSTEPKK